MEYGQVDRVFAGREPAAEPWGEPLAAARREFAEELGQPAPDGHVLELGDVRQRSGKRVRAWALEGDFDVAQVRSNTCVVAWPPRSGRMIEVPLGAVERHGHLRRDQF